MTPPPALVPASPSLVVAVPAPVPEPEPVADAEVPGVGRLLGSILRISAPSVLENLTGSMTLLVSTLMVSALPGGEVFLGAAALTNIWFWRLSGAVGCSQVGAAAMVARRWGAGEHALAGGVATHAVLLNLVLGTLASVVLFPLAGFLISLQTDDPAVLAAATSYFRLLVLAFGLRLALYTMNSCLRAAGDTRTPLATAVLMLGIDAVLTWMLMFGTWGAPRLLLDGAAWALIGTYGVGAAITLTVLIVGVRPRRLVPTNAGQPVSTAPPPDDEPDPGIAVVPTTASRHGVLRLSRRHLRLWWPEVTPSILRVSLPTLGEEVLYSIAFLTFIGMVGKLGTDVLAAHSVAVRIESLSFNAGWGIAVATAAMVGQAMGAGHVAMARRLFSLNATVAMTAMGLISILIVLFPRQLLWCFGLPPMVESIALVLLYIVALEQCFMGASMTIAGGLRGAGYTLGPLITLAVSTFAMRLGVGYWLAWPMEMGIEGIYWATVLDWAGRVVVLWLFVRSGKWEKVRV